MFASLLIKQMRESLQPDTLFGQDRGDVLGGLFDHYLGQHLAESGSLGIGAMVRHQLSRASNHHEQPSAAGPHH
jgi:Rod binding domain-containing protein